jgi:hypothetical protein
MNHKLILFLLTVPYLCNSFGLSAGVPINKGEVIHRNFTNSTVYPGTKRNYSIYIPHNYDADKPPCLYVAMDGISYNAPDILDSLISTGDIPPMIGVFVTAGVVYDEKGDVIRFNRSNEYDKLNDAFARFLINDLLPDVRKQFTSDGKPVVFSDNPNNCMLSGNSSGAICAFTVAWQRPDLFGKVFSAIGTYVPFKGGNEYPALIRKTEPKPIRIFIQDGSADTWNPLFGSWFEYNVIMESALSFAGYEVKHEWGSGGHDGVHATEIFPDVMKWLWEDWPGQVKKGNSQNGTLRHILDESEDWAPVSLSFIPVEITSNSTGEVFLKDENGLIYKMNKHNGLKQILKSDKNIKLKTTLHNEKIIHIRYIDFLNRNGLSDILKSADSSGTQIAFFPNHKLLVQTELGSGWISSYVVSNEQLINKQQWYWLHNPENENINNILDICFDDEGYLYAATNTGIQICDHNGRVRAILTLSSSSISSLSFGGENLNILYAISEGKLYKRKLKVTGTTHDMDAINVNSQGAG